MFHAHALSRSGPALLAVAALVTPLAAGCTVIPTSRDGYSPPVVYDERPDDPPPLRDQATLRDSMLFNHNEARRRTGAPPLVWSTALAADARAYAEEMARTGRFAHADQSGAESRQGENLWMGTRGAFSYNEMVGAWVDERRIFKSGLFPDNSTTGKWQEVAHYTQIVWPTSLRMGCAVAANRENEFLVCRYDPPGNIVGRNPMTGR